MNTIFIVGDKFTGFSENDNVITISDFEKIMIKGNIESTCQFYRIGQGVSYERTSNIYKNTSHLNDCGIFVDDKSFDKSGRHLVHKHNSANSMIGFPSKLSKFLYAADVHIDDRCSELDDHITGQHISGMVLVEACRQMFLAVTELFYLNEFDNNFYFVIKRNSVEYKKFVFPIDVHINYEVLDYKVIKSGVLSFNVSMDVVQCDEVCATVCYEFVVYDELLILNKEAVKAKEIIKSLLIQRRLESDEVNEFGASSVAEKDQEYA